MKRRGRASGSSRKAVLPKARKASMLRVSTAHLQEQLDRAFRERDEALEQLSATSEILKIISKSPGELEQVFDAMLEKATRICDAKFATLYLSDGDTWRAVAATRDAPPGYVEARKRNLLQISPGGPLEQVINTKQVVHIADLKELRQYRERHPTIVAAVELGGFRTCLMVPMLRDDELIGAISILRQEVRPFTDKQIDLFRTLPRRPSSPSRTRGCSMSCVSAQMISPRPWNIRLQPAKSSTSLADHQMSYASS